MRSFIKKLKLAGMVIGILGLASAGCVDSTSSTTPSSTYQPVVTCYPENYNSYLRTYNNSGEDVVLDVYDQFGSKSSKSLYWNTPYLDYSFPVTNQVRTYHVIVKAKLDGVLLVDTQVTVVNDTCNKQYSLIVPKYQPPVVVKNASFIVTNYTSEHLALYIDGIFQEVLDAGKSVKYTNFAKTYHVEVRQEHYDSVGTPIHQVSLYDKNVTLVSGKTLQIDIDAIDPQIKIYNDTDLSSNPVVFGGESLYALFNESLVTFDSGFADILVADVETYTFKHVDGNDNLKVKGKVSVPNWLYLNNTKHFEENAAVYEYHIQ